MRRLAVHAVTGNVAVDVTCTSRSYTVGMRMWNDVTTCDATLRDHGRVLATYRQRRMTVLEHHSVVTPVDAYEQTVDFAGGAELFATTGWDYEGDPDLPNCVRTAPCKCGPVWR